ncbi:SurA N-terminal domain-containing protein [Anaerobiospirillum succiniciproducens]|uniref:SurA N-terminal domain-containing protein n=1 Tax=Anaerobiospirillum succiniciproducens TaxID=13335 RepID=UPI003F89E799
MLSDKLRDGANSKGFKLLLALIVISFVLTGVGGYLIPRLNTDPVTIGDYKITSNDWNNQYNQQAQQLHRLPNGSAMLENQQYVVELKKQVLERMINNVAFNSSVWDMDIRIGDEQVRDVIRNTPAFQKDGKFDNDLYLASIRNMGMSPDYFGEQLRISIMSESVSRPLMSASSQPLPYELNTIAKTILQTRVVNLYTVDEAYINRNLKISDDEIKAFYDANHDKFMAPANVRFNYLLLSMDDLRKQVEVTDEKVEEFYNMYSEDYRLEEQRQAAHLLIRAGSKDADKRIAAVEEGLKNGTPFEKLVAQYSDDQSTKDKGGDMGFVTRNQLAADLDAALFALESEGDVSAAITDDYGTHFIRLTSIKPEHTPALAEVKDKVKAAYIEAQARELYNERVTTMSDMSFENPDSLDITAEKLGIKVMTSDVVAQGDTEAKWPFNTKELQDLAFNEEVYNSGINSNVIALDDNNSIVINVTEHQEASLRPFDDVAKDASAMLRTDRINEEALKTLTDVATKVAADTNAQLPDYVKVQKDVEVSGANTTTSQEFAQAIFALPQDTKSAHVIDKNNNVQTLAVLNKVVAAVEADVPTFENAVYPSLAQYLNQTTQDALYRQARTLNKIEYNQEAIDLVTRQNDLE